MSTLHGGEAPAHPWFPGGERTAAFIVLVAVLYAAYLTVRPFLMVVLLAAAVVSLTYRPYRAIVRLVGGRGRLGGGLTTFALFVGVLGPLVTGLAFAARRILVEMSLLAQHVRVDGGAAKELVHRLGPLGPIAARLLDDIGPRVATGLPALAQSAAGVVSKVGTALAEIGVALLIFTIAVYYFYVSGPGWRDRLIRLLPLPPDGVRLFLRRFQQVSAAVLLGNFGSALSHGVVSSVAYLIFGVPLPLLWGAATSVASLVPLFGSLLVWLPLSLFVGLVHGWARAIGLVVFMAIAVGLVDNLVRPLLSRTGLRLHPLLIFLAIFGGLASFGVAGLFLGPLALVLTVAALDLHEQGWAEPKPFA